MIRYTSRQMESLPAITRTPYDCDTAEAPVRVDKIIFVGLGALAFAVLALTVVTSFVLDEPIATLTRDPMAVAKGRPYFGFLSNVGVVVWSFSAAVCLFTYIVLSRVFDQPAAVRKFILSGGLISLILLGDDLFMLHEGVYPHFFRVTEHVVFLGYSVLLFFYVLKFLSIIRSTPYLMLLLAGFFFAASIGFDLLPEDLLVPHHLFEDGAKFLGIVNWFGYQLSVCIRLLDPRWRKKPE
jgi:hypothetical protein